MKQSIIILLAGTFVMLSAGTAGAQHAQTLQLDLDTAIDIALSDNPTIKAANMEIERYDYVRREVIGNHMPQLSATGQYAYSAVKQEMAKGLSFGADNTFTATAQLTLPLFAPAVYANLKLTRAQQEAATESARSSRIEMVSQVKKTFFMILLSQQSLEVLGLSEQNLQETINDTRAMYQAGMASEYDLLTVEVQMSNLQPTILQTKNAIYIAKQSLRMLLSVPENVGIEVTGVLDDYKDDVLGMPELTVDIEGNSELRSLDLQQQILRRQIKLVNSQRMPVLAGFGTATYTGNDMDMSGLGGLMGGGSGTSSRKFWWQHPVTVGVNLSVPIFAGLTNVNKVRQLRNSSAQIDLQRDYLKHAKEVEALTAINNLVTARQTMFANEQTVGQAERAYKISRTRYEAGSGTMLELNNAELNLTQARMNYSQAIYNFLSAKADYDKIAGREE